MQGDERDVILFSVTFWKDMAGKLTMDFGPLNRDGGERRLNVAVTRARQELIVFSGFTPDQIDISRTKALGVHHLKTFLDYAERGAIALPAEDRGSVGGHDSPFEEAVAAQLQKRGWTVVPQVGISGFRIDLGVRHPDFQGSFLAGVECDGATYHSSATARDRDKIREQVLNGLGWKILRVWSTDWWFDPEGCAQRLHESLEELLRKSRERRTEEEAFVDVHWEIGHQIEGIEEIRDADSPEVADVTPSAPLEEVERLSELVTSAASASTVDTPRLAAPVKAEKREYRIVDLSTFQADPDRFFDFDYRGTLASMIEAVMDAEGPLRIDVLAQRIARAHGWLRTGGRIRERVGLYLRSYDTTTESSGVFVWKKGQVVDVLPYRPTADETSRRAISEIPLAELASIIIENPDLLDMADPPRDMARLLGVERLAATARVRLEEAIEHARRLMAGDNKSAE